ncbi:hypothetical protein [Pseudogracilibacillus sp. SO30301A]|uniref:hypothetical protein n=1 Tax=Pseudogracilibacillus sp. SO30301A TaxID=3098291 RepID=UPI00300DDFE6
MNLSYESEELLEILRLIQTSLEELYVYYELGNDEEAKLKAAYLTSKYDGKIRNLFAHPVDELPTAQGFAEMILVEEYLRTSATEEATNYIIH